MYQFAPACPDEAIVFGACRPGYTEPKLQAWIAFMQSHDIQRVCCLLSESQMVRYPDLLQCYQQTFGADNLCWAPIPDFHLCEVTQLQQKILPFLSESKQQSQKTVVHCRGGLGRTGHILAAWLVFDRGWSTQTAIAAVRATGRKPDEAVWAAPFLGKTPWRVKAELHALLDVCRRSSIPAPNDQ